MKASSRKQAFDMGLKTYFTGKPCINGHISKRNTVYGYCIKCVLEANKKKRTEIKNKIKGYK